VPSPSPRLWLASATELDISWPVVLTGTAVAAVGWFSGARMALLLHTSVVLCGAAGSTCEVRLLEAPGVFVLAVAAVRLLETTLPVWKREWRAFGGFAAACGYLWTLP